MCDCSWINLNHRKRNFLNQYIICIERFPLLIVMSSRLSLLAIETELRRASWLIYSMLWIKSLNIPWRTRFLTSLDLDGIQYGGMLMPYQKAYVVFPGKKFNSPQANEDKIEEICSQINRIVGHGYGTSDWKRQF